MTAVIPLDEFVTEELYPGYVPSAADAPWAVEPSGTFSKADEQRFWFLDFHWPRGLTPMGLIWNEDGSWGSQVAAERLALPQGHGITHRVAGTHPYASALPVAPGPELAAREVRFARVQREFLAGYPANWQAAVRSLDEEWRVLRDPDLTGRSPAELGRWLRFARRHYRRAFEIHFEMMYPLLANHLAFYQTCVELGLEPREIGALLQGFDTKMLETDQQLWRLTNKARDTGLAPLFAATPPERLRAALAGAGAAGAGWLAALDEFLAEYGWRTEGSSEVMLPSWLEDPTPVLGTIRTFLSRGQAYDFAAARAAALAARDAAVDAARSRLRRADQQRFDAGLASCQAANFLQWQDDHAFYIDLRVALPLRRIGLALAQTVDADRPDDLFFLFWPELMRLCDGERSYPSYRALIRERRDYYRHWYERRAELPKVLGTVPTSVDDPTLIEIFGLNERYLQAIREAAPPAVETLTGIPAAAGQARGRARVIRNGEELHRVQPGEVVVCESTSPSWTPMFAKIAACVCDNGGILSHAAIVGREYGVPTVTAVPFASQVIVDGDELVVDGTAGTVTIYRRAGGPVPAPQPAASGPVTGGAVTGGPVA
ncbi:MAG TPA: PEP-utilizing enzyme [Natronosporangium sp.]